MDGSNQDTAAVIEQLARDRLALPSYGLGSCAPLVVERGLLRPEPG